MAEINNDNSISSLDDISLEGVHNPQEPNPTTPSSTGGSANDKDITSDVDVDFGDNKPKDTDKPKEVNTNKEDTNDNSTVSIKSFEDLVNLVGTKSTEDLSDEENEELSDIVSAFGGEAFNKEGAIVDEDGTVLYTAEQVQHYLSNDELPVDEQGNFVNAAGEVVKTKSEIFRETTTVGTVMNALAKNFNVTFNDSFIPDDTEDSIIDVVNKVVGVVKNSSVENYMQANPELEAFRKHLLLHGSASGYNSTAVDYDKVVIKDLSKEAKQIYITEAYKASGRTLSPAYAKYLDSLGEEDYNLEVSDNLAVLKKHQASKQQEVDTQLKQREEQEAQATEQYWNTVTNTIKNGKLSNINIPIPEREAFLAYVTTPVQNGKSKDMLDAEKEDVNTDLLMSYLRYKGNDISALAKNIAATNKVQTLREKMSKNKQRNASSDKGHKPRTQNDYIPNLGEVNL